MVFSVRSSSTRNELASAHSPPVGTVQKNRFILFHILHCIEKHRANVTVLFLISHFYKRHLLKRILPYRFYAKQIAAYGFLYCIWYILVFSKTFLWFNTILGLQQHRHLMYLQFPGEKSRQSLFSESLVVVSFASAVSSSTTVSVCDTVSSEFLYFLHSRL